MPLGPVHNYLPRPAAVAADGRDLAVTTEIGCTPENPDSKLRNRFPLGLATIFGQSLNGIYRAKQRLNPPPSSQAESILPRIAAGEAGAMDRCIDRYGAMVWTIARRHLGESAETEDLVQEIFTEIWKKAATFDHTLASEATFVGLIARRRAIDQLRRRERQPGFDPLETAESIEAPLHSSARDGIDAETLRSSVAALPDDTRQLFQLFFDEGFTHPEIAERTGLPLGTVKTRLRRGLLALRDRLLRKDQANLHAAS